MSPRPPRNGTFSGAAHTLRNGGRTLSDSLAPLRDRNIRTYLGGQAVSVIGFWMQQTAQSWVVWQLSGSGTALGFTAMLTGLPLLLLGPWMGVYADRWDRRKVLLATQTAAMALAFVFALLIQFGLVALWHVFVLATLLGIVTALDFPATQAFIGDLAGMGRVRQAIILNASVFQVSRMVGPALAGWAIGAVSVASAFWINGVTFLAVIGSLLVIRGNQVRRRSTGRPLDEFREGLAFLRGERRAQDLLVFTMIVTFFGISSIIIIPAVVGVVFPSDPRAEASTLGFLLASSGAGALVGTLLVTPLAQRARRTGVMLAAASAWSGVWLVLLSFSHALLTSAVAIFLVSVAIPVVLTTANGLLQLLAPPDMRARLLAILVMFSFGAQPIAAILIGVAADLFTPLGALLLNGILTVSCTAALLLLRSGLLTWEARPGETAADPSESSTRPA